MSRWTLRTLDGLTTYTFLINPNRADSLVPTQPTTFQWAPSTGFVGNHRGPTPAPWSFSGVLRTSQQYDDLLSWIGRPQKVILTTDLGEVLTVRLLSFAPDRSGPPRRAAPFRHLYTIKTLLYAVAP